MMLGKSQGGADRFRLLVDDAASAQADKLFALSLIRETSHVHYLILVLNVSGEALMYHAQNQYRDFASNRYCQYAGGNQSSRFHVPCPYNY